MSRPPAADLARRAGRSAVLWAAAAWSAIYLVVALGGQRFSTAYLDYGWQLISFDILESDPLRSVWYLHVQPPLWNLTLGGLAWLSPWSTAVTFQLLLFGFGVVGVGAAAALLRRLGVRRGWAAGVAVVAMAHPEVLRAAFEPTYELPVAALLLVLAWAIARTVVAEASRWALVVVAAVATAVVMTRSLYHPLWALGVVFLVAWLVARRVGWRVVLVAALVPIVAVGAWMAKNEALFGRPTLSSWFGMNLQRAVIPVVPREDLQRLYDEGTVSAIAMVGPFGAYDLYEPWMPPCTPSHDHPALTEPGRTTNAYSPNFNYECYLPVFDQAGEDAWAVIRAEPDDFVEGRLWSARTMFAVSLAPGDSPSWPMRRLDDLYRVLRVDVPGTLSTHGWGTPIYGDIDAPTRFGILPILMYAGLSVAGLWCVVLVLRRRGDPVRTEVYAFAGVTALFTFVVGIVGELGEQARFRTMTDPLVWVLAVTGVALLASDRFGWSWFREPPAEPVAPDDQGAQAVSVGR